MKFQSRNPHRALGLSDDAWRGQNILLFWLLVVAQVYLLAYSFIAGVDDPGEWQMRCVTVFLVAIGIPITLAHCAEGWGATANEKDDE